MCLSRVFTDTEMEKWLADKPEVIEVYKLVSSNCKKRELPTAYVVTDYVGLAGQLYQPGLNKATSMIIGYDDGKYWSGFHFVLSENEAKYIFRKFPDLFSHCLKCLIEKKHITALGYYWGMISVVASQAVFPHYPETEARLEDVPKEAQAIART